MNREEWEGAVCGGAFLSRISIAKTKTFAMSSTPGCCTAARYRCRQLQGMRRAVDRFWHKTNQSQASLPDC